VFGAAEDDRLVAVGDLVNKGPDSSGALDLVERFGIRCALGNHEAKLLKMAATLPEHWSDKERRYEQRLGASVVETAARVANWPLWIDLGSLLVVHAGLEPGKSRLEDMSRQILITIRTWDGVGAELDRAGDPAWFDCTTWPVPVVFGHWAMRGFVDRPDVKGLDTGCVYGMALTGWCPEEGRFYRVPARRCYAPLTKD
jgi:bis(5'-nucleosyl)-tetraphosphatase (symmetrical)